MAKCGAPVLLPASVQKMVPRLEPTEPIHTFNVPCWCALLDGNKAGFMALNGINHLIALLKARDERVRGSSCFALGVLCTRNPKAVKSASEAGAVSLLVSCLDLKDAFLVRWVVFALYTLIEPERNREELLKEDGFTFLSKILDSSSTDDETRQWALDVVSFICMDNPSARAEASNSGLIEPVVALLRDSSNTNVVKNAAFALGNICLDSNANKSKVKLLGGVQVLFNVIRTVPKKEKEVKLRLAATTTMLSLCDENVELPEDVRKVVDKVKKSKRPGRQIQEAVNKISYSRSSLCGPSFAFMYPERSGSQTSQTMQGDLCGD